MAKVDGRWLVGTPYRDIMGADDPPGASPRGDFIVVGPGNDYLIADIGADVFGFAPGDGYDYIDHFKPGEDKIQFGGGLSAASLTIRPETLFGIAGLAIYYAGAGGPDAVFLAGVSALQPNDIVFEELPGTYFNPPVSDFNVDMKSDIVLQRTDGPVAVWTMNGSTVTGRTTIGGPGEGWTAIDTGDFEVNWKQDLLFRNSNGTPTLWHMNGTSLLKATELPNPGPQWQIIGTGHFTEDAAPDILFRHEDGSVAVWQTSGWQNPIGTIPSAAVVAAPGADWKVVGIADLNGDYRSEVLLQHTDGSLGHWRMEGTRATAASVIGKVAEGASVAGTGDFDGNGKDDILIRQADGTLTMWAMNGTTVAAVADIARPEAGWLVAATGDYDGSGKDDILLRYADGTLGVWLMNGASVARMAVVGNPGTDWDVV